MAQPDIIFPYDLHYLWAAGYIARNGGNPYAADQLAAQLHAMGWPPDEGVQGLTHPPWNFWLYVIFSWIPFEFCAVLWTLLIGIGMAYGAKIITGRGPVFGRLQELSLPRLALALFAFPPVLSNLVTGQINVIGFLGLLGFYLQRERSNKWRAGLLLSLSLAKPHLLFPLYVAVFARDLVAGQFLTMSGFAAGFACQVIASLLLYPQGFVHYAGAMGEIAAVTNQITGASLSQVLSLMFPVQWLKPLLFIGATVGAVVCVYRLRLTAAVLQHVVVPLSLLLTPYLWTHAMLYLMPGYLRLVNLAFEYFGERFRFTLLLLGLVSCFYVPRPNCEPAMMVLCICCLAYGCYHVRRSRGAELI